MCEVRCRPRHSLRGTLVCPLTWWPSHAAAPHVHPKSPKSPLPCPKLRPTGPDPPTVLRAPGPARPRPGGVASLRLWEEEFHSFSPNLQGCGRWSGQRGESGQPPRADPRRRSNRKSASRGARTPGNGIQAAQAAWPPTSPQTYLSSRGNRTPT